MNESAEYEIRLKDSFSRPLKGLETKMNGFEKKLKSMWASDSFGGSLAATFSVTAAIAGVTALGTKIISLGAQMEQTKISFETMLGSSEKADGFIKQLQQFARVTPFVTSEVLDAGKQMLAFGFQAGEVIPQLTRLGDISSGLSIPLNDMIYLFGTLKTQGRAMTKDIMQFAQRGIPIYDSLAKVLGVSKDKVGDLVTDGKVGFKEVEKAFELMTKKGSMFGGLMDKQSRSLAGRWSTFLGTLEEIGTVLGEKMIPLANKMVDAFSTLAEIMPRLDFSAIGDTFKDLFTPINDILNIFRDMFGAVGASIGLFDVFQGIIKIVALNFRVLATGVMVFYTGYKIIIQAVKDSFLIWQGLGDLISGVFTLDETKIYGGINKIKLGFTELASNAKNTAVDFVKGQADAYKKIFTTWGTGDNKEGAAAGTTAGAMGGLSSKSAMGAKSGGESGVEKISAGTRNVVININKLVENVNISKTLDKMGNSEMVEAVKRALLTASNDVNIMAGS